MKIKLTPQQAKMLIDKDMIKHRTMKLSGSSAKNLGNYIKTTKLSL